MSETNALQHNGKHIGLDAQGYLLKVNDWDESLVPALAEREGLLLTNAHWQVIRFVRAFYLEYNTSPAIRALVKALQLEFGPEVGNSRYLQRLFPGGPAKQATKLAGLPKPAKCL